MTTALLRWRQKRLRLQPVERRPGGDRARVRAGAALGGGRADDAYEDIFTRAVPLLSLVVTGQLLGAVDRDWPWWGNLTALLGARFLAELQTSLRETFADRARYLQARAAAG